ncbi:transcription termination factor MTERF4, chloroplastic-like isoform X1 [Zingiber officinale]|uniref:transcription termination factor MTERF4, chloroplastic-like isoform X1 n=2 Tax=Zingiber officinale TaxID=94328 RepID=UPI001C4A8D50|nr:transcription termination factor MTERF4, chloroplastic-like isoform X1 [Zingiber officinale]
MLRYLVRRHALPPSMQLRLVFFSAGTSVSSSGVAASPDPLFMVEYLVNTCGFSADDASKVSKSLPRNKSTENPDVVLGFLRYQGFDGANLRKVISLRPRLLGCHVEKNLAPKFQIFRDMGLSESDVIDVVLLHPAIIDLNFQNTLLPRLKVWESLFGSKEILLNNLRRHGWFMTTNIENVVRPNMNFLQDECGIPLEQLSFVLRRHPCFIVQNPESLRALVDRAEGIGIPRGSGMFLWILDVLHGVSREKFEAQVKLMNSFDFSNSDFVAAIKKYPWFLWLSTETLQRKMEFLVKDVGITPSNIAKQPVFLALSLEKRVIPRFHVLEILKSEGLWTSQDTLRTIFLSPGPKFMQKYVLPYKDKLPKLFEVL